MNILITGHDTFENKGCQALIYTTTRLLKEAFPAARFRVFSWDPSYDAERFDQPETPCEFIRHRFNTNEFSLRNRLWLLLNGRLGIRTDRVLYASHAFYDALCWADLVVVSGGDILADYGEAAVKHYFFPIAVAIALHKKVFVFAQSISRYRDDGLRDFARRYLDRVNLITVRERLSYDYLRELGVAAPLHLTADPAFLLQPCSPERVEEIVQSERLSLDSRPLIGLSVSNTVTNWGEGSHENFIREMAETIERLAARYDGSRFLFVPHVIHRDDSGKDDRSVAREIYHKTACRDRLRLVEGDYQCDELKGVIGLCDLFIGARTHATIASASQAVPTVALAYSTKAYGIMDDVFDRERCVLSVRELTAEKLSEMAATLLEERERVVRNIDERLTEIRARSTRNGELAKGFVA